MRQFRRQANRRRGYHARLLAAARSLGAPVGNHRAFVSHDVDCGLLAGGRYDCELDVHMALSGVVTLLKFGCRFVGFHS